MPVEQQEVFEKKLAEFYGKYRIGPGSMGTGTGGVGDN